MAEMKTERKSVLDYLSKNKFLIPMYQRAYTWGEDECLQLWEDIYLFFENKEDNEEYFFGSIVMYKENGKQNIIDGQQRTTTLSLLIRALYEKARVQPGIEKLKNDLASCIWDIDELNGEIDFTKAHLKSEVATDFDNSSLENLFSDTLDISYDQKKQSLYEKNFVFFTRKIDELAQNQPTRWREFCLCLLRLCIVLPIECDGQENALRIFNTINNRGVSLNVADIFKGLIFAQKSSNLRNIFAGEWKKLESRIQNSSYLKKEDISFLFAQYEHILRAQKDEVDTVIPSVLDFWTKKDKVNSKNKKVNFAANDDLLLKEETFEFIKRLGDFWCDPYDHFTPNAKKYFDILNIYQNKLWQMVVSMCFYQIDKGKADKFIFDRVLPQITAYCALGLIYGKGGTSGLFWGFMKANVNIKDNKTQIFEKSINLPDLKMPSLENFVDFSKKALPKQTRYLLSIHTLIYNVNQAWEWNEGGKNYSIIKGEIEHIFPQKWQETSYQGWSKKEAEEYLQHIGNKILIEKKLNIQVANNYFARKKTDYKQSKIIEVADLGKREQEYWLKEDIESRNKMIYERLKEFFIQNLS